MKKTIMAIAPNSSNLSLVTFITTSFMALMFVMPFNVNAAMLTQELDFGMTNSDVTSLQTFLAGDTTIYPEGIVTGYFGGLTKTAVTRFQTVNGLSAVGRVGPQTLTLINSQMNSGGSSNNSGSTGNIGGDIWAPVMYPQAVVVNGNSVNISWNTNEASKGRVMYGTSWPFLFEFAPSVSTNVFSSSSNVNITGLQSNRLYYYVLESIDGSGNTTYTLNNTFFVQ